MTQPGPVVLVVEDDDSIRHVITDVLEDRGMRVINSSNGAEALMPVMHGWDFMESYAEKVGGETIPIVVVSVNPALPRSFNRFGVRNVLGKPFDVDELADSVEAALMTGLTR